MNNIKKTFIIFSFILCLLIQIYATYKVFLISTDKAVYEEKEDGIYFKYIPTQSNLFKTDAAIGDKLISVNDIKIENRHYLHNLIFDRTKPSTVVLYRVFDGEKLKIFSLELEKRFTNFDILFSFFLGLSFLILIFLIFFNYLPSKTMFSFFFLFLTLSFISVFINVPFSNRLLYLSFIVFCLLNQVSLFIFTKHFLTNIRYFFISYLIFGLALISIILWAIHYFYWTTTLKVSDYKNLMNFVRFFQLSISMNIIHSIVIIMKKILKLYENNSPVEYFVAAYSFIFIILTYPIFYSLPIILRKKELIPFYFFFLFYFIALILMLRYKTKLQKVFL
ncbi:MAG: hypothetical protein ABIN00_04615 [candidate division WOR-3 bacterium]